MQFYDFIYRKSVIHKLDPRTKILWLLGLTALVFLTSNPYIIVGVFLFVISTIFIAKLPVKLVWNSSKIFVVFFTISYIILFSLLLWDIKQGIIGGILFSIKFLILILSAIIFAMATSPQDILLSLVKLRIPYEFAFMLTLAIRFIPVIIKEINIVITAQKARAHKMVFTLKHPIEMVKSIIPIIIPTIILLLKKSFDLSMSIESRAFRATEKRTYPPKLKFLFMDYFCVILLIGLFVLVRMV